MGGKFKMQNENMIFYYDALKKQTMIRLKKWIYFHKNTQLYSETESVNHSADAGGDHGDDGDNNEGNVHVSQFFLKYG